MNNNYQIISYIAEGSFNKCYLVLDANNRKLVLKKPIHDDELEGIRYFELREIFCLIKLQNHPNIIPLKEVIFDNDSNYNIILKYVNTSLNDFIFKLDTDEIFLYIDLIIEQLLSVIYFVHINNIIHTDIKQENILIEELKKNAHIAQKQFW